MTTSRGFAAPVRNEKEELLVLTRSLKQRLRETVDAGCDSGFALAGTGIPGTVVDEKSGGSFCPERSSALEDVRAQMGDCRQCELHETRRTIVFGEGNPQTSLVFVGEAPGEEEDRQGRPFVGRAGALLTKIIEAMGLNREDVYICNILKCRPPGNRNPLSSEIECCEPFLVGQLKAIRPKVICALGTFAAQTLLKVNTPITALRGRFHTYEGIPLMPTYHPAYLLRNSKGKRAVWEDMQMVMEKMKDNGGT